jgi:hypothetical protein
VYRSTGHNIKGGRQAIGPNCITGIVSKSCRLTIRHLSFHTLDAMSRPMRRRHNTERPRFFGNPSIPCPSCSTIDGRRPDDDATVT